MTFTYIFVGVRSSSPMLFLRPAILSPAFNRSLSKSTFLASEYPLLCRPLEAMPIILPPCILLICPLLQRLRFLRGAFPLQSNPEKIAAQRRLQSDHLHPSQQGLSLLYRACSS